MKNHYLVTPIPGLPKRVPNDFYATPARCTRALLSVEHFDGPIWEPACGNGAISKELPGNVISTDLVNRGFGLWPLDFLLQPTPLANNIVTNPPFKLADYFIAQALNLGCGKIAMFMRLSWLEGAARHERLWKRHPPVRIWTFAKRQTLWRGDAPNPSEKGGTIAFAWFVWEYGYRGAPSMGWLP